METTQLAAEPRTEWGTRAARALRARGRLPVIIYGHNEPPESVSLSYHDIEVALAHGARMVSLALGAKAQQYLIKDVQYDHLGDEMIHIDLARVSLDERVQVPVAVELRGTPKGVAAGGVLEHYKAEIEVECLVTEIPGTLHPLVTHLDVGDSLLVRDLSLPPGVVALDDPQDRVATVRAKVEEVVEEEPEEGAAETAEPELIGKERKEEKAEEDS